MAVNWATCKMEVDVGGVIELRPFEVQYLAVGFVKIPRYAPSLAEGEICMHILGSDIPKIIKTGV